MPAGVLDLLQHYRRQMPKLSSWIWGFLAAYLAAMLVLDADLFSSILCALSFKPNAFKDKVVWITGASSGIGAQLARDLAKEGAQVVVSARRVTELEQVADSCEGLRPYVLPLDVTDYEAQSAAYDTILATFGRVDILVLNAGRTQRSLAERFEIASTKELFELNVFSVINLAKMVVPDMILRKSGQVNSTIHRSFTCHEVRPCRSWSPHLWRGSWAVRSSLRTRPRSLLSTATSTPCGRRSPSSTSASSSSAPGPWSRRSSLTR